jgi:hypothetical protein
VLFEEDSMPIRYQVIAALIFSCFATVGCVRTNTELLDSSTAIISARGTAFDTPATVLKTTVVEAAKLAQAHDFRYFAIVSAKDATRVVTKYIPPETTMSGNLNGTVDDFGNVSAHYNGTGYTTPGHTEMLFIKPGEDVVVRFFREGEIDPHASGVWDVEGVLTSADIHAEAQPVPVAPPIMSRGSPSAAPIQSSNTDIDEATQQSQPAQESPQRFDEWQKSNGK